MADTLTTWQELRELGRISFGGQTPGRALEAALVERFEQHPGDVRAAIVKLGGKFTAGKVHTPWPLVLKELEVPLLHAVAVADAGNDVERRVRLAERWIRNAGLYEVSAKGLQDALFGEHGPLRAWAEDLALRSRLEELWQAERPRAIRAELEQQQRAVKHRAMAERMRVDRKAAEALEAVAAEVAG